MAKAQRIEGIECEGSAALGIKLALTERFDEMCTFRRAALDWKDPEGVHSMRVASRRLRSALRDFTPYVNKRGFNPVLRQMKSVADALGEVRDQDVAILELETLASHTQAKVSSALLALIETRKELRHAARAKLKSTLSKDQLKQLKTDFEAAVARVTVSRGHNGADITYIHMAGTIIRDRLNELVSRSDSLYAPLDVEPLHEMRIAVKRLRYAIELFQGCLSHVMPFVKNLANLQSALGSVHDCDVWIESFGKHTIEAKKLEQQEQVESFVWLLNHFAEVRNKHLSESLTRWGEWESEKLSSKLRDSLNP